MAARFSLQRTYSVARKESLHIVRDPGTLFFALFIPVLELFMLGYAIDTNVRHVRTVACDFAMTKDSRNLLEALESSQDFKIVAMVYSEAEVSQHIVAGKARVGIVIPPDYSKKLEAKQQAIYKVVVDGSESSIAGEANNVSNALALRDSLARLSPNGVLPVEVRPQILYNPESRASWSSCAK